MSAQLPERWSGSGSLRVIRQAARAEQETALAIRRHELVREFDKACESIDSEVLTAGVRDALDAELHLLEEGMQAAGNDAARRELVARYASLLNKTNLARLARRYGQ